MSTVTLTFDDGLPVQVEHALPELNNRNLEATFFIIQNSPYSTLNVKAWREAAALGHEIGAHSVDHLKPAAVTESQGRADVRDCKAFLEREIGHPVTSYAYPYTHVTEATRDEAVRNYKQARGGRVARVDKFITKGDGVDMYNLPCHHVGGGNTHLVRDWIDEAVQRDAWLILMFHGIGPDEKQWDNVCSVDFTRILNALVERQPKGLTVETMEKAAARYR